MRTHIRNFWKWYNQVQEPRRFIYFMVPATILLWIIPLLCRVYLGIDPFMPQVIGVTLLVMVGLSKEL